MLGPTLGLRCLSVEMEREANLDGSEKKRKVEMEATRFYK